MANKSDKINISLSDMTDEDKHTILSLIRKYSDDVKTKKYIPEYREPYWYISIGFNVYGTTYYGSQTDNTNIISRNAFPDYESAAFEAERRKVICELKNFADEHNESDIDWNNEKQGKHIICFNYSSSKLIVTYQRQIRRIGDDVFFTSFEIAESAIEHVGEERIKKYVFGIEVDRNEES